MNEENSIDIYKPCVKQTASGKLLYNTGSSAWCFGMTRRDGMGVKVGGRFKREGIHVHLWLIHVDI